MRLKENIFNWTKRPENLCVLFIAGLIFVLHFVAMFEVHDYIHDEIATIAEANFILYGEEMDPFYIRMAETNGFPIEEYKEVGFPHHMPLGKLIFASSIWVFGDNVLGWRIFPSLFGVASIILFYLICQKLTSKRWLPLVATFVFAFENMCFVMSGIAMLDVFGFTIMLASFLLYLHSRYIPAGIVLGLAVLAKMNVAYGGIIILLHFLFVRKQPKREIARFVIAAPLTFLILIPLLDYLALGEFIFPWDRIWNYINLHADPTLAQGPVNYMNLFSALFPWEWLTSPKLVRIWPDPSYEMNVNWTLWVLIIPLMAYMLFETVRQKRHSLSLFALLWFVCGYLPWFLIYWLFDRVSYPFYFYPIVPAVCLAAGYAICRMVSFGWDQNSQVLRWGIITPVVLWLTAHFVMFWLMAPIF